MFIDPLFNRIFVEPVMESAGYEHLIIPIEMKRDRGRVVNAGTNTTFKVGDLVYYDLRAMRLIKFEGKEVYSLDEDDVQLICTE
jgi:co-chaperonin GroES (HSP10)